MPPHDASCTHQLRSGAARLVRLTAVTCLALAAGSATVWAQAGGAPAAGHRCIHDQIQQHVLQSVVQQHGNLGTLSAVGLPVVAAAPDLASVRGKFNYAVADGTPRGVTRSNDWGELRVTLSAEDLTHTDRHCTKDGQIVDNHLGFDVPCTAEDILTEEKRDILMNSILPEAVGLHTERLKVRQVQSNWTVTPMSGVACGSFKVPQEHATHGVNNTDFLLYVASAPSTAGVGPWAAICQVFPDGQPAVGVINVPAAQIVSRYDQRVIRTVAHQIAHALGFSNQSFVSAGIKNSSSEMRDKPSNPPVIKGNTTIAKARDHYGCPTLQHVELQDPSDTKIAFSHLDEHNAKDELMAPEVGAGYYSALTMAIFEDTRFYKADFSKAEAMTWGRNASCDFLKKKCMENNITKWPQMFCNPTQPQLRCTSSRLEMGKCGPSFTFAGSASDSHSFTQPFIYGDALPVNSCPYVEAEHNGACNLNSSTASDDFKKFSVFSDAARCIDGAFAPKNRSTDTRPILGMCANVQCDNTTNTYSVQVKGSSAYVNCTPGQHITLDTISDAFELNGYITCPPYAEVCQGNLKAAMDFKADLGKNRGTSSSSSGRGDTHTDSMPSNGKGDSLNPRGNGAAGLHHARTLVSAGVALLVVTLTVGLSA